MPGPTVVQSLLRNNPFPRKQCSRAKCPLDKCMDNCAKESVLYKSICRRCEDTNRDVLPTYIGETSRTLYVRANQHREDCLKVLRLDPSQLIHEPTLRKPDCSSWMVDHFRKVHKDEQPPDPFGDIRFDLVSKQKDPMNRQIEEACRIKQSLDQRTLTLNNGEITKICPLNRKGEFFCPRSRYDYF